MAAPPEGQPQQGSIVFAMKRLKSLNINKEKNQMGNYYQNSLICSRRGLVKL